MSCATTIPRWRKNCGSLKEKTPVAAGSHRFAVIWAPDFEARSGYVDIADSDAPSDGLLLLRFLAFVHQHALLDKADWLPDAATVWVTDEGSWQVPSYGQCNHSDRVSTTVSGQSEAVSKWSSTEMEMLHQQLQQLLQLQLQQLHWLQQQRDQLQQERQQELQEQVQQLQLQRWQQEYQLWQQQQQKQEQQNRNSKNRNSKNRNSKSRNSKSRNSKSRSKNTSSASG
jgi:hypothetical protein